MGMADEVLRNSYDRDNSIVKISQGIVKESFSESSTNTHVLNQECGSLFLSNDGTTSDIVLTVGTVSITLKATESINENFDKFSSVTVTNSGSEPYRLWVRA